MKMWVPLEENILEKILVNLEYGFDKDIEGVLQYKRKEIKKYNTYINMIRLEKLNIDAENKFLLELELNNNDIKTIIEGKEKYNNSNILLGYIDKITKSMIKEIYSAVYYDGCLKYSLMDNTNLNLLKKYL